MRSRKGGFSSTQLVAGGYTLKEIKKAGFTASEVSKARTALNAQNEASGT